MCVSDPVTCPLTSTMWCWARSKMASTSNYRPFQHWSLRLEGKTGSPHRSVCGVITPVRWRHFTRPVQTVNTPLSSQMSTFSTNPHPSNDSISGTVCSLVLSEGDLELKLTNLTEMIEVNPVCLIQDAKVCVSVWLRCFFPVDLYAAPRRLTHHI